MGFLIFSSESSLRYSIRTIWATCIPFGSFFSYSSHFHSALNHNYILPHVIMSSQTRRGGIYPVAGVSVLLTIISFVLVILTIFAGNKPGFMEDYHILYVSSVCS